MVAHRHYSISVCLREFFFLVPIRAHGYERSEMTFLIFFNIESTIGILKSIPIRQPAESMPLWPGLPSQNTRKSIRLFWRTSLLPKWEFPEDPTPRLRKPKTNLGYFPRLLSKISSTELNFGIFSKTEVRSAQIFADIFSTWESNKSFWSNSSENRRWHLSMPICKTRIQELFCFTLWIQDDGFGLTEVDARSREAFHRRLSRYLSD